LENVRQRNTHLVSESF